MEQPSGSKPADNDKGVQAETVKDAEARERHEREEIRKKIMLERAPENLKPKPHRCNALLEKVVESVANLEFKEAYNQHWGPFWACMKEDPSKANKQ